MSAIQKVAIDETPRKIPILYGIDAIHGANYIQNATLFPHNIGIAATRNPALAKQGAEVAALETRASGIRWNFDPVVGMGRQPLWSRFEETFGEDVYLTSTMGSATIRGYEGSDLTDIRYVASCMKHYIGYSVPRSGKDRTPSYIPETELRNIFLPPFKAAVDAGTSTVMINSGEVNGEPVHGSKFLLQDLLRDELGFEGLAVSDWEDIIRLHTRHKIAATPKEAVKIAVNAGIDMSMVPLDYSFYDYLLELAREGAVSMKRIDEAVGRILKLKFRLGLFDQPYLEKEAFSNFGKEEYKVIAKNAALESITLLKNDNATLPLPKGKSVLIAGPAANNVPTLHGSWSFTWQGTDASKYPESTLTIKEAFENKLGAKKVSTFSKTAFDDPANYDEKALLRLARRADYIILCLGEDAYAESPGVIDNLELDENQKALARAAKKAKKPMILILTEGRPRIIRDIEGLFDGILMAYRPGSQGANAIADIILGDANPSGRLPFTYPAYSGDLLTYDHKFSETIREDIPNTYGSGGYRPQYPFGHGLSYTTFEYSNLKTSTPTLSDGQELEVSVTVQNTGEVTGKHAVELYVSDRYASVTPAVRMLKGYQKITLKPGESQTVTFKLNAEDLSFVNKQHERITEAGEFDLYTGKLTTSFTFQ
ncbi:MAG: glycoside hydrolase family 3 N-terminal domain-containing protein [Bacteroidota bacterium]